MRTLLQRTPAGASVRLPCVVELAHGAGVSYVTMWKAVRRLADEGLLRSRRRSGIWSLPTPVVGRRVADGPVRLPGESLAGFIARHLRTEIASGTYRAGTPLPPAKEMAVRLQVCPRTVHAALRLAHGRGTIARDRRHWVVPQPELHSSHLRLLLFAPPFQPEPMLPPATYSQQVHHQLEAECSRRAIAVEMAEVGTHGAVSVKGHSGATLVDLAAAGVLAGCAVLSDGLSPDDLRELLNQLRPLSRPVAVLANTDDLPVIEPIIAGRARVRLFTVGNDYTAGRRLGDHLARMGHRRIAYVCMHHHRRWSAQRLAGLQDAFEGLAAGTAVHAILSTRGDEQPELGQHTRKQLASALRVLPAGRSSAPDRTQFLSGVLYSTEERLLARHRRRVSARLVQRALGKPGVTAWVAGNDLTAIACLDHLAARGLRPPRPLSLAAFDDTYAMLVHRVTAYHFDTAATARAILDFALSKDGPGERKNVARSLTVEPQGQIVTRDTLQGPTPAMSTSLPHPSCGTPPAPCRATRRTPVKNAHGRSSRCGRQSP